MLFVCKSFLLMKIVMIRDKTAKISIHHLRINECFSIYIFSKFAEPFPPHNSIQMDAKKSLKTSKNTKIAFFIFQSLPARLFFSGFSRFWKSNMKSDAKKFCNWHEDFEAPKGEFWNPQKQQKKFTPREEVAFFKIKRFLRVQKRSKWTKKRLLYPWVLYLFRIHWITLMQ